eukprot:scaffold1790_cov257-Pinguiococcus_pyrenoidosus.AAC.51
MVAISRGDRTRKSKSARILIATVPHSDPWSTVRSKCLSILKSRHPTGSRNLGLLGLRCLSRHRFVRFT